LFHKKVLRVGSTERQYTGSNRDKASSGLSLPKDFGPDTISRIAKLHTNELAEQSTQNIKHDDKKLTS